ncbi:MAG: shikimate dehydrogenase [Acaryochloridaceae cyanobacterium RU_4_10]|nr:shikimate dehydrogenase [Acaryochloridaceae cyanobacterium RU_4_10]
MTKITGNTKLLGIMGCPIEHSLSPVMHNAALAARALQRNQSDLDYVYLPLRIEPIHLESALLGMAAMEWQGFNVTIPHKQAILPYLKEISPLAQAVGAVNTVWQKHGAWVGTNTDVRGFLAPLQSLNILWNEVEACVLGSGGSARAVIAACAQLGCAVTHVVGRNRCKLEALQQGVADAGMQIQIHDWQSLNKLLPQMGLIVNTTPLGMHPHVNASPLDREAIALLPASAIVYDLIYTPRPTQLLTLAKQQGYITLDGLEMLIHQGAAAFEIWIGELPDVSVMRQAALEVLA